MRDAYRMKNKIKCFPGAQKLSLLIQKKGIQMQLVNQSECSSEQRNRIRLINERTFSEVAILKKKNFP